jgi:hypothetical protein
MDMLLNHMDFEKTIMVVKVRIFFNQIQNDN